MPNYDEIATQLKSQPEDKYDSVIRMQKTEVKAAQLNGSVSPEDIERAKQYGVSSGFARDNAETLKPPVDYDAIIKNAPKTAEFLKSNPVEDPHELSQIELISREWNRGRAQQPWSELVIQKATGLALDPTRNVMVRKDWTMEDEAELNRLSEIVKAPKGYDIGANMRWIMPEIAGGLGQQVGFLRDTATGSVAGGAAGATIAGVAGQAGPQIATPEEIVTVPLGFAAGAGAGARMYMWRSAAMMEAASAYDEYMKIPNMDHETALGAALAAGGLNGLIEIYSGPEGVLRNLIPGKKPSIETILRDQTVGSALKRIGAEILKAAAGEGGEEFAQSYVTTGGGAYITQKVRTDGEFSYDDMFSEIFSQENLAEAFTSFIVGAVASLGAVGMYSAPMMVREYNQVREAKEARARVEALGEAVRNSRTAQGSETAINAVVPEDVSAYFGVDSWDRFWQSKNVDPKEVADFVTGDPKVYQQARANGHDIEIPMRAYAAKLAGTEFNSELAQDLKVDPEGMSAREAAAWERRARESNEDGVDIVQETLTQRLVRDGKFEPATAQEYARLWSAKINTQAKRLGEDPMEILDRFGLQITRDGFKASGEEDVLSQPSPQLAKKIEEAMADPDVSAAHQAAMSLPETIEINDEARQDLRNATAQTLSDNYGYADPAEAPQSVPAERKALVILGPPGSGKSTLQRQEAASWALLDPDEAKTLLPEFENGRGANAVHRESKKITADVRDRFLEEGLNVVVPIVGHDKAKVEQQIQELEAKGYKVDVSLVHVTPEKSVDRVLDRWRKTGRYVSPTYIADTVGDKPLQVFRELVKEGKANADNAYTTENDAFEKFDTREDVPGSRSGRGEGVRIQYQAARSKSSLKNVDIGKYSVAKGQIGGLPPGVSDQAGIDAVAAKLYDYAVRGLQNVPHSATWYEDIGREILRLTQNDYTRADRVARIFALLSSDDTVLNNTVALVNAAYEIERGNNEPLVGRYPNSMSQYIKAAVGADEVTIESPGFGPKTLPFYQNIHDAMFPDRALNDDGVAIDRWILWAEGFPRTRKQAGAAGARIGNKLVQAVTRAINDEFGLGLKPRQVQALIWTQLHQDEGVKEASYHDVLSSMTQRVTWEAVPSFSTEEGTLFSKMSPENQAAFLREAMALIRDDQGRDVIAQKLGIPLMYVEEGEGFYDRAVHPNVVSSLIGLRMNGSVSTSMVEAYAGVLQQIYKQDAVPWFRMDPALLDSEDSTDASVLTFEGEIDGERLSALALERFGDEAGFTISGNNVYILNWFGMEQEEFYNAANEIAAQLGAKAYATAAQSEYGPVIDWANDPTGSSAQSRYAGIAARSPDLQQWVLDRQRAFEGLARRYGAGNADLERRAGTGNPVPVRGDGKVELVHYSTATNIDRIDPAYYGRGIAGAEVRRKVSDPEYWVDRSYYGIGVGSEQGYKRESALGNNVYVTSIEPGRLYDMAGDPLGLKAQAREMGKGATVASAYEMLIKQAGFAGYYVNHPSLGMVAAVFEPLKVESNTPSAPETLLFQRAHHGTPHRFEPMVRVRNKVTGDEEVMTAREYESLTRSADQNKGIDADRLKERLASAEAAGNKKRASTLRSMIAEADLGADVLEVLEEHPRGRFSVNKIGTGEGHQAYGYGLYFSSKKEIAEYYRDNLAGKEITLASSFAETMTEIQARLDQKLQAFEASIDANAPYDPRVDQAVSDVMYQRRRAQNLLDRAGDLPPGEAEWQLKKILSEGGFSEASPGDLYSENKGHIYEVNIPDTEDLLDYDKPFIEQPPGVIEKLKGWPEFKKKWDAYQAEKDKTSGWSSEYLDAYDWVTKGTAGEAYQYLFWNERSGPYDSDRFNYKKSSEFMQSLGIPGLTYIGDSSGTRNFVIWDDNLIEIERMYQGPEDNRAYIAISPTRKLRIGLLENADLTSFLHESGHAFLEMMRDTVERYSGREDLTESQEGVLSDAQTILDWFGKGSWDEVTVEDHEKFARAWEKYLGEGNAPSVALRRAFARFRSWVLSVYRTLRGLDVELNDSVRGVFDRMLATDEQIDIARNEGQTVPIFTDAASAQMTDAEFANYRKAVEQANITAREQLEQKLIRERQRETRKWWVEELRKTQGEVEDELKQQKVYIAAQILKTGKRFDGTEVGSIKVDLQELKDAYPADVVDRMKALRITSAKDGMPADMAASLVGYRSGDEMIQALRAMEPMRDVARQEARKRMLARHGDMLNDGSVAEQARLAVANDKQMDLIGAEIRALRALQNKVRPMLQTERAQQAQDQSGGLAMIRSVPGTKAARDMARGIMSQQRARDIKPGVYMAAARKASRQAVEAAAKGNYQEAAIMKQRQLLNLALYQEAIAAKDEIEKHVKYLRNLGNKTRVERLAKTGYLEQIRNLLARFDLARLSLQEIDRRTALHEFVASQKEQGITVSLPAQMLDEGYRKNYRDMTLEEIRGLRDSVKHLDHLSLLKNKLLKIQDKRAFDDFVTSLTESIEQNKVGKRKLLSVETNLPQKGPGKLWKQFIAMHRKVASYARVFDGLKDGGLAWEAFVRIFNVAADQEAERRMAASERLQEIFARYTSLRDSVKTAASRASLGAFTGGLYAPKFYPELKTAKFDGNVSHMGKLMMALNWGNEGNRQRLVDGYGWTTDSVQRVLNTLTESDWQFVRDVWEYIDSFWPEIAALSERVDGIAPQKVEGIDVVTPFGTFKGSYFPIQYNPETSSAGGFMDAKEEVDRAMSGATIRASTRHGFREVREDKVMGRPINLDVSVIFRHINDVIHDITHYEALVDANRVLRDERVHDAITSLYGAEVYQQFKSYLNDVAAGDRVTQTAFDRIMLWMRAGVSIVGMGLNFTTAAIQVTGFSQSVMRIRPHWAFLGLKEFYQNPIKKAQWIQEKSSLMRQRARTQLREINEIQNTIKGGSNATSAYFWMIAKMQQTVDMPTWLGQYRKSLAAGENEAKAVALADQAVVDSQMGGQTKDLAAIQRGNPLMKLFTAFYSYFNATMNLTAESMSRTNWTKPKDIGAFIGDMLLLYTVPAVLGLMIREAMRPGDDDEDEPFWVRALREQASFMMSTLVGFREASGVVQGFYGYEGPAGTRGFSEMSKLATQIAQGEADEAFWRSLNNTAGIMLHYPAGQVDRTVRGMVALSEGDTDNPMAVLTGPPRK